MERRQVLAGIVTAPLLAGANEHQPLGLPTSTRQGSVLRGKTVANASVQIGSLVPPFLADSSGNFLAGLSRTAPPRVEVRSGDTTVTLEVAQRRYLNVTITGTARSGADAESSAAPNSAFGDFRGLDLFDGGDADVPQDPSERSVVVAPDAATRETRQQRIDREAAAKRTALASRLAVEGYLDSFQMPVSGPITSDWGAQRVIITQAGERRPSSPHCGVDIRALSGTRVSAPAGGVVTLAERDFYYDGGIVCVDHGQGLSSVYLHLSTISCTQGQSIVQGAEIGRVGASGRATGPHLCWRMKWRGVDVDPTSLLGTPA